jgi:hypothetical protein
VIDLTRAAYGTLIARPTAEETMKDELSLWPTDPPASKGRLLRFGLLLFLIVGWACLVRAEETRIAQESEITTKQLLSDFSRSLGRGGV